MVWFGSAIPAGLISASEQLGVAREKRLTMTADLELSQGHGRPASRAQATHWEPM